MKQYENEVRFSLTSDFIVIRVDGKNFSRLTKKLPKFYQPLEDHFNRTALQVASKIQNCIAFYPQSDECSFLMYANRFYGTEHWFGGNINKINSVTASLFTYYFNNNISDPYLISAFKDGAFFDCRCMDLPDLTESSNYFVWRIKDANRNAISQVGRSMKIPAYKNEDILKYLKENGISYSFPFDVFFYSSKKQLSTYFENIVSKFHFSVIDINRPLFSQIFEILNEIITASIFLNFETGDEI